MKRRYLLLAVLVSSVLLLAGFQAGGLRHMVTARLSGYGENLPVSTAATGEFTAAISPDNTMIEYTLSYSNLEGGPAIGAHIHFGQWWSNGGVIAFLCGGGGKPACPATSGTVSGTIIASDIVGPAGQGIAPGEFGEALRALRAGVTYANVHTPTYPGGEIRGQIAPRLDVLLGR